MYIVSKKISFDSEELVDLYHLSKSGLKHKIKRKIRRAQNENKEESDELIFVKDFEDYNDFGEFLRKTFLQEEWNTFSQFASMLGRASQVGDIRKEFQSVFEGDAYVNENLKLTYREDETNDQQQN